MSEVDSSVVTIRLAREADLPHLEWEGEYRRYRRLYRRAFTEAERGWRLLFVADCDGEVVGQLFVQVDRTEPHGNGRSGYLYAFRVRPAFRNRGIGTRLVEQAESALRAQGYRRAIISVARENPDARRLYERIGYSVYAEDAGQWSYIDDEGKLQEVDEPAFLLEKVL